MLVVCCLVINCHVGLSPCGFTAMRVYRHVDLSPISEFIAMRVYRQASLPPCGFIANGGEILP